MLHRLDLSPPIHSWRARPPPTDGALDLEPDSGAAPWSVWSGWRGNWELFGEQGEGQGCRSRGGVSVERRSFERGEDAAAGGERSRSAGLAGGGRAGTAVQDVLRFQLSAGTTSFAFDAVSTRYANSRSRRLLRSAPRRSRTCARHGRSQHYRSFQELLNVAHRRTFPQIANFDGSRKLTAIPTPAGRASSPSRVDGLDNSTIASASPSTSSFTFATPSTLSDLHLSPPYDDRADASSSTTSSPLPSQLSFRPLHPTGSSRPPSPSPNLRPRPPQSDSSQLAFRLGLGFRLAHGFDVSISALR